MGLSLYRTVTVLKLGPGADDKRWLALLWQITRESLQADRNPQPILARLSRLLHLRRPAALNLYHLIFLVPP